MLSVIVAHSYFLRFDRKQLERSKPYPPLATLQVASMLRQMGHDVSVFDAMLADGVDAFRRKAESVRPQLVLFYEDSFNFLTKMCLGRMREACCEMIAMASAAGARVMVAGSDATDTPGVYLQAGADLVVLGEGLAAVSHIVERLNADPRLPPAQVAADLDGVALLRGAQVVTVKDKRSRPSAAANITPAWDLIDLENYRSMWRYSHGYFSVNMAASRGCSFRCHWCSKPIWGNQYLQRNAADVAREMAWLKRSLAPDHIWFADDIFGFRVEWLREFARCIHELDGVVPFTIQTRADLCSAAMVAALREAGCVEVWIGAESGSQRVLDAMNKGTTVQEIAAARARLEAANIRVGFFIQLGYLGEQLADILATRELIENSRPDDIGVSVSYPLPGTKFYEQVRAQLGSKTHWQDSSDLEMMFHGTYHSDFYRRVRDLLHEQVEIERLKSPPRLDEYRLACQSLTGRWQALLSEERRYRTPADAAVGVG